MQKHVCLFKFFLVFVFIESVLYEDWFKLFAINSVKYGNHCHIGLPFHFFLSAMTFSVWEEIILYCGYKSKF